MQYNGNYIYPPRTKMTSALFVSHKAKNGLTPMAKVWSRFKNTQAQLKLNGNRNLIKVSPKGEIEFWNRHAERQQKYTIPPAMEAEIRRISPSGVWTVWDSELMNFKTKEIKDVVYMYDVLVWQGEYLFGKTYGERYELLKSQIGEHYIPFDYSAIDRPMYLAQNFAPDEWPNLWETLREIPWIEGLVAKRFDNVSALEPGNHEYNNSGFMMRFRKPHKNYGS